MAAFLPLPHQLSHDQMDFGNCEFESSHWMCPITPVRCGCLGSHSVTSNLANARGMGKSWQYLDQWITFVFNGAHSHTRVRNPLTGYPPIFSQASTVVSGKLRRIPFATHHFQVACYVTFRDDFPFPQVRYVSSPEGVALVFRSGITWNRFSPVDSQSQKVGCSPWHAMRNLPWRDGCRDVDT